MITIHPNPYAGPDWDPFMVSCDDHEEVETAPDFNQAKFLADNPEVWCPDCDVEDRVSV